MKTNYKFAYISRKDDVHIDECGIRFYEGDVTTENEKNIDGEIVSTTKYRMKSRLANKELKHLGGSRKTEKSVDDVVIYTSLDFGVISTDDELRMFLNRELKKDVKRIPVDEQNVLDITKVP